MDKIHALGLQWTPANHLREARADMAARRRPATAAPRSTDSHGWRQGQINLEGEIAGWEDDDDVGGREAFDDDFSNPMGLDDDGARGEGSKGKKHTQSKAARIPSRPKSAFVVRDDERAAASSPTKRPTSSSIYRGGSVNTHDPSRARPLTAYPSSQPHHCRGDGVAVGGGGWGVSADDERSHFSREGAEKRGGGRPGARRRPATALASSSSRSTTQGHRYGNVGGWGGQRRTFEIPSLGRPEGQTTAYMGYKGAMAIEREYQRQLMVSKGEYQAWDDAYRVQQRQQQEHQHEMYGRSSGGGGGGGVGGVGGGGLETMKTSSTATGFCQETGHPVVSIMHSGARGPSTMPSRPVSAVPPGRAATLGIRTHYDQGSIDIDTPPMMIASIALPQQQQQQLDRDHVMSRSHSADSKGAERGDKGSSVIIPESLRNQRAGQVVSLLLGRTQWEGGGGNRVRVVPNPAQHSPLREPLSRAVEKDVKAQSLHIFMRTPSSDKRSVQAQNLRTHKPEKRVPISAQWTLKPAAVVHREKGCVAHNMQHGNGPHRAGGSLPSSNHVSAGVSRNPSAVESRGWDDEMEATEVTAWGGDDGQESNFSPVPPVSPKIDGAGPVGGGPVAPFLGSRR